MKELSEQFKRPIEVSEVDLAFGGNISDLMPEHNEIPKGYEGEEFWKSWQSEWFFEGLKHWPKPKEGIDRNVALAHLKAIQVSFEPKHEHKEAGVAWLASLWFENP
jgi:hypothetical protein